MTAYHPQFALHHRVVVLQHLPGVVRVGCAGRPTPILRRLLEDYHGTRVELLPIAGNDPRLAVLRAIQVVQEAGAEGAAAIPGAFEGVVATFVREVLEHAVEAKATDLFIRHDSTEYATITMRAMGLVTVMTQIERGLYHATVRHVLNIAGVDPFAETIIDANVTVPYLEHTTMRLAYVRDAHSSAVALRFLRRDPPLLATLGFDAEQGFELERATLLPHGLVVCCGPTGSGKTTTAAALVRRIVERGRNVVSVEDPVEYRIAGCLQIERSDAVTVLPALLRQNPDAIWIGETREARGARAAVRAALTGHLVLTTVHCAGAAHLIPRLLELGVSAAALQSCLRLVVAQRLLGRPASLAAEVWTPSVALWPETDLDRALTWSGPVRRESSGRVNEQIARMWAIGVVDSARVRAELEVLQ